MPSKASLPPPLSTATYAESGLTSIRIGLPPAMRAPPPAARVPPRGAGADTADLPPLARAVGEAPLVQRPPPLEEDRDLPVGVAPPVAGFFHFPRRPERGGDPPVIARQRLA